MNRREMLFVRRLASHTEWDSLLCKGLHGGFRNLMFSRPMYPAGESANKERQRPFLGVAIGERDRYHMYLSLHVFAKPAQSIPHPTKRAPIQLILPSLKAIATVGQRSRWPHGRENLAAGAVNSCGS